MGRRTEAEIYTVAGTASDHANSLLDGVVVRQSNCITSSTPFCRGGLHSRQRHRPDGDSDQQPEETGVTLKAQADRRA